MFKIPLLEEIKFLKNKISKVITNQLLVVSFEVTLSCNCNCCHCDLGGYVKEEKQIKPEDYGRLVRTLKPLVIQLSGGEPLLRKDIVEIAKSAKQFGSLPYIILVTNGVLLNKEIYLKLKKVGINQFSVSLDFPDERHDEFRRHPGLFKHLQETIPQLAKYGFKDIILNSVITKSNFRELIPLAQKAKEWGVFINYSAYTPLRTGNKEYAFENKEDLKNLQKVIQELIEFKTKTKVIITTKKSLLRTLRFFEEGYIPNCQAGRKFVVVMPDGSLVPCSLQRYKFSNLKDLIENFSQKNSCGNCYVSIRCYSESPFLEYLQQLPLYLQMSYRYFLSKLLGVKKD